MLEDKIIVQDRGMDAGLMALMQNANKGSMDPAALMAMMNGNGGGMGGNNSWIWIILLFVLFGGFGGNGFGGNKNGNVPALAQELNTDANTNLLMQAINGNKEAISSLSGTLHCDINSLQGALSQINSGVSQISCDTKLSSCQVINAITAGNAGIASQMASCCCDLKTSIERQGFENQLATVNQTAQLQQSASNQFNIISAKIDAQTTLLNDRFCQLEMREMQNKIDTLRSDNTNLSFAASQQAQTANIINQLRQPSPVPAYVVANPNCCNSPLAYGVQSANCGC